MLRTRALWFVGASAVLGCVCGVFAQAPANPSFDVASIKVTKNDAPGNIQLTPGRFRGTDLALRWLVLVAYKINDFQLAGDLPNWTLSERYNVEATAADGVVANEDITLLMLQNLLQDRFKLRVHRETRNAPVYELRIAKGGIKMHRGICTPTVPDLPNECGHIGVDGLVQTLDWSGVRLSAPAGVAYRSLAWQLSGNVKRPVLDKTGLDGTFDVHLRWARDESQAGASATGVTTRTATGNVVAPSLFTALEEQLGLKLESSRGPVDVLMIDHVEHPTEN